MPRRSPPSSNSFFHRRGCQLLLLATVCPSFALNQPSLAQDANHSGTADQSAVNLAGPLKIVKLLWKANPQNAASTLARSIAMAADRQALEPLKAALESLHSETLAVVAAADLSDPRYAPSLAARLLDGSDPPTTETLAAALEQLENVEQRQLVWQIWLIVDQRSALLHFDRSLTEQGAESTQANWHSAMIATAVRAAREPACRLLIERWQHLSPGTQLAAIEPMTATSDSMLLLLQAVTAGTVSKDLINPNQLKKWLASDHPQLTKSIEAVWGRIRQIDNAARAQLVASTLEQIHRGGQGSASRGSVIFDRVCSQCHVLHGRGYEVGPNIAGNGRGNLGQLVSNILDPSLVIGEAFQAKTVLTVDGEVVSGLVTAENDRYLTLKVQGGKTIEFNKEDLEAIKTSNQSLMPEGVESQMQPQELLDLLAYLCVLGPPEAAEVELIPGTPLNFVQP